MRIISRYIARDVIAGIGSVAVVLLLIILGKLLIQLLAEVLDGDLGVDMLGSVLLLGIIRYLVILLPFAFFIAIIMVLSRMYRDSEANAIFAAGAGRIVFVRAVTAVGIPLIIVLYLLVAYVSPWAARLVEVIENVTEQGLVLSQLTPGKFFELEHTGWVVYAEAKNENNNDLLNVFVQRSEGDKTVVEVAESARVTQDGQLAQIFVLQNGQRLEGVPGQGSYLISEYQEHRVYPARTDFSRQAHKPDYQPIDLLWGSSDDAYQAELFQRGSIIVSTLILMLLAVPLSKVSPNSSRFARLALAVAIYILYLNLVIVSCSWIKRGESFGFAAVITIHVVALICTLIIYNSHWLRHSGYLKPSS